MSKANKAVVERWGKEIWNAGNLAAVDEIVAADCVSHTPQGEQRGREAIKQARQRWQAAFPDLRFTVIELTAESDKVVEHWSLRGTHKGDWQGVAGTGKVVAFTGVTKLRIAEGMIAEVWVHSDYRGFLLQVGEAPASAAARDIIDRWARIWNEGDMAAIDDVVSADYLQHSSLRGDMRGREVVRQSYASYHLAFPDMHFTGTTLVAEGDRLVNHWSFKGTHRGEWNGVAATGKVITYTGANVFRIADGRIVENWSYWEMGAFLRQAGATVR